jgi:Anthrone oxygenase
MFAPLAACVGLFCLALVAGIGVEITLNNGVLRALPATSFVQLHQRRERAHARLMPLLVTLALLATLGAASGWRAQPGRVYLTLASGLAVLVVMVVTLVVDVPLNRRIQRWLPDAPPDNWRTLRDRWMRSNDLRTVVSVAALALLLAGVALTS